MALPIFKGELPHLTREQAVEVERLMVQGYKLDPLQLAEASGLALARLGRKRFLEGDARGKPVVVLIGPGSRCVVGAVAARRLHAWGANVSLFHAGHIKALPAATQNQLTILDRMHLPIDDQENVGHVLPPALIIETIVDPLERSAPREGEAVLVRWANAQKSTPTLSWEMPSGIDATSGEVFEPAIDANATLCGTLAKQGLYVRGVKGHAGEVYLADIGVPARLFADPALRMNVPLPFGEEELVRLR
ncbi:YjeF-family domain-containing protein [Isosphaera pallida ATCC 43644]|jgi:NAD(P)H-hydrate epimerase|uniref:YjeF-family domain-containing protein n=1 Tax=Isosphaera pallida (strain ATCC 43644 / DSM 9630 / IS1B) TaxID=575540 RepID=E8R1F3_ISOPI|nr:NAD(P)H-hydrate epimerase [Isosphaera pallida]ADV62370.1 YjeF-family domain-containing protein [Isosphaera pallida ATCC 43644]